MSAQHYLAALLVLVVAALTGCGGGGTSADPPRVTISGVMSDDPVVGATVTVTSLDGDRRLGTAITAVGGTFSVESSQADVGSGYRLSGAGGTMNGQPFVGTLEALYPASQASGQSNITLVTSSLLATANTTTQFSGTLLQRHDAVLRNAVQRGLLGLDYWLVEPAGQLMARLRADAQVQGVAQAIAGFAQAIGGIRPNVSCGFVGSCTNSLTATLNQSWTLQVGPASVSDPAGKLDNCVVSGTYSEATQTLRVHLEHLIDLPQRKCQAMGEVTLELPAVFSAVAPDQCLSGRNLAKPMTRCVTAASAIESDYEVRTSEVLGFQATHRHGESSVKVLLQVGIHAEIQRGFGMTLHAAQPEDVPVTTVAANQWPGRTAVIFVHGFALGGAFGGGEGTWGNFPALVATDPSKVALNFQWKTDTSFVLAARGLAKAVQYASLSTGGRKVHIVAHSFGGLVARALLQNLDQNAEIAAAASKVATLTTAGTPHSGISSQDDGLPVKDSSGAHRFADARLPKGWHSGLAASACHQISCYEAGLYATVADWAKKSLKPTGQSEPGYIIAMGADHERYQFPANLPVQVLIGAPAINGKFLESDGLVRYLGQRFQPSAPPGTLMVGQLVGAAIVWERVLGLREGVPVGPSADVGDTSWTSYSRRPGATSGYRHVAELLVAGLQLADGAIARAPHSEVFVDPQDCGTSRLRPCEHDTWVQTTAFWAAHPAGCATPKVLVNETCIQPAALTSVTPTNALAGSSTTFAVIGTNLPLTAVLQLAGGQCAQPIAQSATGFSTVCTVSSTPGNYLATVRPTIGSSTVVGDATSVAVATPTLPSILDENFDGNLLRGQFWTAGSTGTVSLANGLANFSCYGSASTQGKVSILATQVIVEARAAGAGIDRDVFISLVDTLTGDVIQFGETNYPSNPSWGFYSYGTGIFSMATRAAGSTTNSFMEYRMTISGNQITFERGATLAAISQTVVRTLPTSIAGRQLHLRIGAGGPAHCPATFDWVRVRSQ